MNRQPYRTAPVIYRCLLASPFTYSPRSSLSAWVTYPINPKYIPGWNGSQQVIFNHIADGISSDTQLRIDLCSSNYGDADVQDRIANALASKRNLAGVA